MDTDRKRTASTGNGAKGIPGLGELQKNGNQDPEFQERRESFSHDRLILSDFRRKTTQGPCANAYSSPGRCDSGNGSLCDAGCSLEPMIPTYRDSMVYRVDSNDNQNRPTYIQKIPTLLKKDGNSWGNTGTAIASKLWQSPDIQQTREANDGRYSSFLSPLKNQLPLVFGKKNLLSGIQSLVHTGADVTEIGPDSEKTNMNPLKSFAVKPTTIINDYVRDTVKDTSRSSSEQCVPVLQVSGPVTEPRLASAGTSKDFDSPDKVIAGHICIGESDQESGVLKDFAIPSYKRIFPALTSLAAQNPGTYGSILFQTEEEREHVCAPSESARVQVLATTANATTFPSSQLPSVSWALGNERNGSDSDNHADPAMQERNPFLPNATVNELIPQKISCRRTKGSILVLLVIVMTVIGTKLLSLTHGWIFFVGLIIMSFMGAFSLIMIVQKYWNLFIER